MNPPALHAFAGYGIELEYMIVDRQTLSVMPIADQLLRDAAEVGHGKFGWSNEIVLHLVEVKNARPDAALAPLAAGFQAEVGHPADAGLIQRFVDLDAHRARGADAGPPEDA